MATRERTCLYCRGQFHYLIGRGNDRKYCSDKCRASAKYAKRMAETACLVCSVNGCWRPPRNGGSPFCEMHYYRLRRNGSLELCEAWIPPDREHDQGYILEYAPDHPLAKKNHPRVYEHRRVFYDAHGLGPHRCHWCRRWVKWGKLHVDHKDSVKANNRLENLVPACSRCNTLRDRPNPAVAASPLITFNGETLTRKQWADRLGIKSSNLQRRLDTGWPIERALTEPRGVTGPRAARQLRLL
jgi:hypothetical protein